jgi:hypothetical protein
MGVQTRFRIRFGIFPGSLISLEDFCDEGGVREQAWNDRVGTTRSFVGFRGVGGDRGGTTRSDGNLIDTGREKSELNLCPIPNIYLYSNDSNLKNPFSMKEFEVLNLNLRRARQNLNNHGRRRYAPNAEPE